MTEIEEFFNQWSKDYGITLSYSAMDALLHRFDRERPRSRPSPFAYEEWQKDQREKKRKVKADA